MWRRHQFDDRRRRTAGGLGQRRFEISRRQIELRQRRHWLRGRGLQNFNRNQCRRSIASRAVVQNRGFTTAGRGVAHRGNQGTRPIWHAARLSLTSEPYRHPTVPIVLAVRIGCPVANGQPWGIDRTVLQRSRIVRHRRRQPHRIFDLGHLRLRRRLATDAHQHRRDRHTGHRTAGHRTAGHRKAGHRKAGHRTDRRCAFPTKPPTTAQDFPTTSFGCPCTTHPTANRVHHGNQRSCERRFHGYISCDHATISGPRGGQSSWVANFRYNAIGA